MLLDITSNILFYRMITKFSNHHLNLKDSFETNNAPEITKQRMSLLID